MNAWVDSGRSNTFAHVSPNDVVFRTSSQANSLVLGNGLIPYGQAAIYIASNCVGINRVPDTSSSSDTRIVCDIGGNVACRSGMTWCYGNTPAVQAQSGCNATRVSVSGIYLNNGRSDTISLDRSGLIRTLGSLSASNCVLGVPSKVYSNPDVLTVIGKGVFDKGIRLVVDNQKYGMTDNGSLSFDPYSDILSLGAKSAVTPNGLLVNGTIVSTGQVFSPGYKLLSDERFKRDIVESVHATDLRDVLAINVKVFTLIDNGAGRGNEQRQTGVLAQDISSIMPAAVSEVHDFLPDLMSATVVLESDRDGIWVQFPSNGPADPWVVGDVVRLKAEGQIRSAAILNVDPVNRCARFHIGESNLVRGSKLFVYGKMYKNVLAVDTNQIVFKLVSAVQCLTKQLSDLKMLISQSL